MLKALRGLLGRQRSQSATPAEPPDFQFCSVFTFNGRLYLGREEGHAGPRLLLTPEELPLEISSNALGELVIKALAFYQQTGVPITADEWEVLNRRLIRSFGVPSVSAFERRKCDVTIRRSVESGEVQLHGDGPRSVVLLSSPSPSELGSNVRQLLDLS